MRKSLATAAILIATTVSASTQVTQRCGGSDTSGGCPAPMTNSEVEAARGLDGPTLGVRLPTMRRSTADDPIRPNSSGGGFVDNPTSESNSLRRNNRLENSIGGDTSTSTGGASTGSSPSIQ